MTSMRRLYTLLMFLWAITRGALAAPMDARVHAEVENLLDHLQASGCEFGRNGVWYPAAAATKNLRGKLESLESRGGIVTTETFIDLGASTSSSSGQPYLVRCGQAAPVASRQWLSDELRVLRAFGQPLTKS